MAAWTRAVLAVAALTAPLVGALAAGACTRTPKPDQVLELPPHATPERPDAGPIDAGPGATCAAGDGCDPTCPLLDSDCPDGAVCKQDGLCGSGCFDKDPDCSPQDDGLPCRFGEECQSGLCAFLDEDDAGTALCTRACKAAADCTGADFTFACVRRPDRDSSLCLPLQSCAAGAGALPWMLAFLLVRRSRSRPRH
ncbi:MAG TPA: hypothetical protein VGO62_07195 [Myxococcota bacterium]